jgi:hypothetical protein
MLKKSAPFEIELKIKTYKTYGSDMDKDKPNGLCICCMLGLFLYIIDYMGRS